MTPEQLQQMSKEQEVILANINIEKCKDIKETIENEHAKYVLKKQIVPYTKWYLEDVQNVNNTIELCIGDQIEHVDLEQSFSIKNEYKGTIRSTVMEMGPKYIKISTPEPFNLLIGENHKIFAINKPLYEKEFDVNVAIIEMLQQQLDKKPGITFEQVKTFLITSICVISLLIFFGIMLF